MPSKVFPTVWFLPKENTWSELNLLAFRDSGSLTVGDDVVEFHGKKQHLVIRHIQSLTYGRQGRDFVNKWVKIEYVADGVTAKAFFADATLLGWGGIFGGTKRILNAIQRLA